MRSNLAVTQELIANLHNDLANIVSHGWDMISMSDLPDQLDALRDSAYRIALFLDVDENRLSMAVDDEPYVQG